MKNEKQKLRTLCDIKTPAAKKKSLVTIVVLMVGSSLFPPKVFKTWPQATTSIFNF